MNARRLIIAALFAAALLGTALWYSSARRPAQQAGTHELLVPGLSDRLNLLERVQISGAGNARLATLERGEEGWRLVERGGYPIDTAKLRELLLGLAEARRLEAKTSQPERHDRLGVEDIAREDAGGVLLELEGGGPTVRLVVGQNVTRGSGTYVREAEQAQSWLVDRNLAVEKNPANWLQRDLLDIDTARIAEVEVTPASGPAIRIDRSADSAGDFRLSELPRGRTPASAFVADATAGLLSSLRIDDVRADDGVEPAPASRRESRFLTREGLGIAMSSWQDEGKTWARFSAVLDEPRALAYVEQQQAQEGQAWEARQTAADALPDAGDAVVAEDAEPAPGSDAADGSELAPIMPLAASDPEADRVQRLQTVQDEIDALNARFEGWVFALPNFKAANLNRDLEAYLQPKD
jgi:hypothetical protein